MSPGALGCKGRRRVTPLHSTVEHVVASNAYLSITGVGPDLL